MNKLTPEFLRGLADKLEAAPNEVAKELLLAITEPKHIEDDKWGFNNPVPTRMGSNTTFNKPLKPMNFLQAGTKVQINEQINLEKFRELRQAGFCFGTKFNVVKYAGVNKWLCYSVRHNKHAVISGELLTPI